MNIWTPGNDYRVATLSKLYQMCTGSIMPSFKSKRKTFNLHKLRAIQYQSNSK